MTARPGHSALPPAPRGSGDRRTLCLRLGYGACDSGHALIAQQSLDVARGFITRQRTVDDFLDDAVAVNEDLGGQPKRVISVKYRRRRVEAHRVVETVRVDVVLDVFDRRFLDAYGHNRQAAVLVRLVRVAQHWCLFLAGRAPGRPEVEPDGVAAQVTQLHGLPGQIRQAHRLAVVHTGELGRELPRLQPHLGVAHLIEVRARLRQRRVGGLCERGGQRDKTKSERHNRHRGNRQLPAVEWPDYLPVEEGRWLWAVGCV